MEHSRMLKLFLFIILFSCGAIIFYYSVCWRSLHELATPHPSLKGAFIDAESRIKKAKSKTFNENTLDRELEFNITGSDVLVFLHIQKTGGSVFGKHLVRDISLDKPCKCYRGQKKCDCFRPGSNRELWLFSRFSTGWSCGLHADWTELVNCVDYMMDKKERQEKKRRSYYYITMLREPMARYVSEWQHVQRGATWKDAVHMCDGRPPTSEELPSCFKESWKGVELEEFMTCPYNLANNRQTRMLADLSSVGCYNISKMPLEERNEKLLSSAKTNLRRMAFFGLTELQKKSQSLFERTFGLEFEEDFEQFDQTKGSSAPITDVQKQKIKQLNLLDVELYAFARNLFMQRYKYMVEGNGTSEFLKEIQKW